MAKYFVFHTDGTLCGLASDETKRDYFLKFTENGNGTAKTPTDAQWTKCHEDTKRYTLENDTITEYTLDRYESNRTEINETDDERNARWLADFKEDLQEQKDRVAAYLANTTDSAWSAYQTNLNSVDPSTVTFPIDSFQKWFNSQSGFSSLSIKELP